MYLSATNKKKGIIVAENKKIYRTDVSTNLPDTIKFETEHEFLEVTHYKTEVIARDEINAHVFCYEIKPMRLNQYKIIAFVFDGQTSDVSGFDSTIFTIATNGKTEQNMHDDFIDFVHLLVDCLEWLKFSVAPQWFDLVEDAATQFDMVFISTLFENIGETVWLGDGLIGFKLV